MLGLEPQGDSERGNCLGERSCQCSGRIREGVRVQCNKRLVEHRQRDATWVSDILIGRE